MRSILLATSFLVFSLPAFACSQQELAQKTQELMMIQQELAKNPDALATMQQKMIPLQADAMALAQEIQKDPQNAASPAFIQKTCDLLDKQLEIVKAK